MWKNLKLLTNWRTSWNQEMLSHLKMNKQFIFWLQWVTVSVFVFCANYLWWVSPPSSECRRQRTSRRPSTIALSIWPTWPEDGWIFQKSSFTFMKSADHDFIWIWICWICHLFASLCRHDEGKSGGEILEKETSIRGLFLFLSTYRASMLMRTDGAM